MGRSKMALRNQQLEQLQRDVQELTNASLPRYKQILEKLEVAATRLQHADGPSREVAVYAIDKLQEIITKINDKNQNPNIRDAYKQLHPSGAAQTPFTLKNTK